MPPPRRLAAVLLAAVLASCAACTDVRSINQTSADRRTFPLPGAALVVDSAGADLRLVPGGSDSIAVERSVTGKATAAGNASWSMTGDTLRLRVKCSGFVPDCGGLHVVHVPPGTAVRVSNDAPVRAVGPTGALTATVTGSWLTVERPAGPLRLRASMSVTVTDAASTEVTAASWERAVMLTFRRAPQRVEARATAGAVTITLPAGPETYRVACTPGMAAVHSDPSSSRAITAVAGTSHLAQVRKGA